MNNAYHFTTTVNFFEKMLFIYISLYFQKVMETNE